MTKVERGEGIRPTTSGKSVGSRMLSPSTEKQGKKRGYLSTELFKTGDGGTIWGEFYRLRRTNKEGGVLILREDKVLPQHGGIASIQNKTKQGRRIRLNFLVNCMSTGKNQKEVSAYARGKGRS